MVSKKRQGKPSLDHHPPQARVFYGSKQWKASLRLAGVAELEYELLAKSPETLFNIVQNHTAIQQHRLAFLHRIASLETSLDPIHLVQTICGLVPQFHHYSACLSRQD